MSKYRHFVMQVVIDIGVEVREDDDLESLEDMAKEVLLMALENVDTDDVITLTTYELEGE